MHRKAPALPEYKEAHQLMQNGFFRQAINKFEKILGQVLTETDVDPVYQEIFFLT